MRTTPITESLSLVELSCALVPAYRSNAQIHYAFVYGGKVCGDGHAFSRDDFHPQLSSFILPDRDVGCTTVKEDKQRAIHFGKKPVTTPNSKHIDVPHHFLRERVANREFEVVHASSALQHADFLTKPLHKEANPFHRNFAMNLWWFLYSVVLIFSPVLGYWVIETENSYF